MSFTRSPYDSTRSFHRHALQLRQAKLSFPSTRLLVGVCSDELVQAHKANTIMNHQERYVAPVWFELPSEILAVR